MPSTISKRPAGRVSAVKPNSEITPSTSTNSTGLSRITAEVCTQSHTVAPARKGRYPACIEGSDSSATLALPTNAVSATLRLAAHRSSRHHA